MPYSAQDIINRVRDTLIDPTPWTFWSDVALLAHVNNAVGAIVQLDKKASVVNASLRLAAGTKQVLPGDAVALSGENFATRNMGGGGLTPGRSISVIAIEDLVAWRPNWNMDLASATVRHAMADPDDPRRWYNWPPSDGNNYVEIKYSQVPDDVSVIVAQPTNLFISTVIPMASTVGISAGQLVQDLSAYFVKSPAQPTYPITPGTKVLSVTFNSVIIDTPLSSSVSATDWLSFSDLFPLPDLYAEPTYNFVMAHALDRNSAKGDPVMSNTYWQRFMALLGADDATIQRLGIGRPAS